MVGGWREHICLAGTSFCYILSSVLDEGRAFWLLLKVQPHGVNNSIQIKPSSLITNRLGGPDNVRSHSIALFLGGSYFESPDLTP